MSEISSPLHIPDYRLFWLSRLASAMATTGMVVAIGWQVYDVARTAYGMSKAAAAFQLGLLGLVQFIPLFLLTPLAGLVADRLDRRRIAALSMVFDLTIALALGFATHFSLLSLPLLFTLAAAHGAARVFQGPALSAIAPNIVPAALLPRAIALNSMAWQTAAVLGPALGGVLFALQAEAPYFTAAALLGIAAAAALAIRPLPASTIDTNSHPLRLIADGMSYVWNERFLLGCISLDLFAVLLGGATALLPVFARDILQVGPEGLGMMRAAPAVGAVAVAAFLAKWPIRREVGTRMLVGVAVFGLATAVFGISRWFPLSLAMLALLGAGDMISVFIRSTLVQLNTPDDMRGRVASISGLAISASNELGEMQSGLAAALLGATGAVVFGGVGAIAITLVWAVIFPELRNARSFAPQYRTKESAS